ncbi:heat shock protein beta-9 [Anolis carolinensis]|uniref:heat shock protein beta-9 n=1 Tax=Anolis carolinensis TaxID=28377 RepID=UPI000462E765|nr:PREDICTED: heat shock protein beta-9 [Anolis carolinensis]|eukprot:XP_008119114.1 PREDICTED: heat shock protein beta-9 [Anolis carolinensis]
MSFRFGFYRNTTTRERVERPQERPVEMAPVGLPPRSLLDHLVCEMQNHLDEMERMRQVLADAYPRLSSSSDLRPAVKGSSSQEEESDDGGRSLCYCLDLPGFLPEEVSVKVDGRRVFATGKQDRRGKGQDGCVSHELREMRKEMLLPSDADPSGMSCCFFPDEGRLRIQTPRVTSAPLAEKRSVAIAICRVENTNTNAIPPADCKEEAPASPEKEAPAAK